MGRIIVYLLILATGGSLAERSTSAERYKAWVYENQNWKKAVGNWKKSVEASCNVSDADEYWQEAFTCPNVSGIACQNDNASDIVVDDLGCSTTICKDGLYTDQMAFFDMWRQNFNTYKTMMSIWGNKLVDCACAARKCLDSDAVTLEAWNSQSLKYSELSMALLEVNREIEKLHNKSEDSDALTDKYSQLSSDVLEAGRLIAKLQNQSQDWDAMSHKYEELSAAVWTANDQIEGIQNKSEERYSTFASAMTEANERIDQLQNNSETHTQTYIELSSSVMETKEQVEQFRNTFTNSCPMKYNGKCFWIECQPLITIEQGRSMCSAAGGRLAHIYSSYHHYILLKYLRMFVGSDGSSAWVYAWVDMTYDSSTNTVLLSDGTRAPFVKWQSGYPKSSYSSVMYLESRTDREHVNQHLVNAYSTWNTAHSAICEK